MNCLKHHLIQRLKNNTTDSYVYCCGNCCSILFTYSYKLLKNSLANLLHAGFALFYYACVLHSVSVNASEVSPSISAPGQSISINDFQPSSASSVYIWGGGSITLDGFDYSDSLQHIVTNEKYILVFNEDSDLEIYTFIENNGYRQIANFKRLGRPSELILENNILYLARPYGLQIIKLDNPLETYFSDFITLPGGDHYADLQGNYVYITDDNRGLIIIDITDPYEAFVVSYATETHKFLTHFKDIKVEQDYAYLIDAENLYIVNISNVTEVSPFFC